MNVSFNWLKEYLGEDTELTATKAAELLGTHAFEIEAVLEKDRDTIIDVDILPNRSSDCLCHRGIARELASITGVALARDPLAVSPELIESDLIAVEIADPKACPRFTASLIEGVEIKDSPQWLKDRLEAIGQRSINNIVDATNYVMFAIGQPLHAYDAELFPQVDGTWQFGVRYAKEGETVSLIAEGGKEEDRVVECTGTELLIVDRSSDTPIGLAGVKGGRFAGVHEGTKKVIIEAAHFDPIITRKTARRLGIVIDASKRFENEPSRELPPYAQCSIIKLITDIAGGKYVGSVDTYLEKKSLPNVAVSAARTNALLGLALSIEEMEDILLRAGCEVNVSDGTLSCIGPWERTDLTIEEDFIEEIGRLHGYDHVESVVPEPIKLLELNKRQYYSEQIRHVLLELGYSEVITSSFRKKDTIQLHNALASDKSFLRSGLTKNIQDALAHNANFADLLGTPDIRLFEIGTVFDKVSATVSEHVSLAFGVQLRSSGYSGKEDKIIAQTIDSLKESLSIDIAFATAKGVAECNLTNVFEALPEPSQYQAVEPGEDIVYQPFSPFPHMSRDIALWVSDGVERSSVQKVLKEHAGALHTRTTFLDEFKKAGRTSYAFRLVFQSDEKTLTDEEVNKIMDSLTAAVAREGWEVR